MILLVDDDPAIADVLARALRGRGYEVRLATTGGEALVALPEHPDVMLLDINLPDMTGWDVLRAMTIEQRQRVPVIVLSASSLSRIRVQEFHPAGVLTKPFPLEGLCVLIEHVVHPPAISDTPSLWRHTEEV